MKLYSNKILVALLFPLMLAACAPPVAKDFPDTESYSWVAQPYELKQPLLITNAGDGSGRLFIVEKSGRIVIIEDGEKLDTFFLDIESQVLSEGLEQGLLGLAFHPNYSQNGFLFVYYVDLQGDAVLSRFQISQNPNRVHHASEDILMQILQPSAIHNGGHLEFGPDGYLYIGVGDGGLLNDFQFIAQVSDSLLGSILRIDVDSDDLYSIPQDNPFADAGGRPEVWAIGLRNPWRFTFDPLSGDLYLADVGEKTWEEVNFLAKSEKGGANFGWPYFEGTHTHSGFPAASLSTILPVAEYEHEARCSVTGGVVYRGLNYPELNGIYLYGDFCSGEIFGLLRSSEDQWETKLLVDLPINITSFGVDETGELYVVGFGDEAKMYALQAE